MAGHFECVCREGGGGAWGGAGAAEGEMKGSV